MKIVDTLKSLVTGLGTSKDKSVGLSYTMRLISDAELSTMHRTDWLARKIVDIIPNDMTREWRDWQAEGNQIELIEELEAAPLINTQLKVNEAMRRARLLRGSAIYIGLKNAKPEEPLELDKVKKGDLQYLNVLNRRDISTGQVIRDVTSEFYGEPEYYEVNAVNSSMLRIHPSRIVRFVGADILDQESDNDGWGDSILQVVYDSVQNAGSVQQHIAALVPEAKTDVIYVPRLSEFLRDPRTTQQLTDRFGYANMIKSMFNMVLLEGDGTNGEKWEQKEINFSQLPAILQQFLQIASGAADIPVTRLLGQSPSGLNATGESDIRNYYDNISARQRTELGPNLHRLDEVTIRSALGSRPREIYYTWAPLWGLSEKEKAEIFSTKVTAVRNIAGGTDPLMPINALSESLVNMVVEDGTLPGVEAAMKTFGTLEEQEPTAEEQMAALNVQQKEKDLKSPPDNVVPFKKGAADAEPATLYVRRDVLNADEIYAWAKGQGMTDLVEDLHVTIIYSRAPFDWIKAGANEWGGDKDGNITIQPGGPRVVEPLGGMTAVLMFASSSLCWRHEEIVRAGASHDYDSYQPHISLTKAEVNLDEVEPYRGKIVLGPEIFEKLDPTYGDANPNHEPKGSSKGGQFAKKVGATAAELRKAKARAYENKQVAVRTNLSKQEVGTIGEQIVAKYLASIGYKDVGAVNTAMNNYPVDLAHSRGLVEVKTGLVSNGPGAQQWRATIGQPGVAETALLKTMTPEEKAAHNEKKSKAILARKAKALREFERKTGKKPVGETVALIMNPDKKVVDVYHFKGFHLRIGWNSDQASSAYAGSYSYG